MSNNCQSISVLSYRYYDGAEVAHSLEEWIAHGSGPRYGHAPHAAICDDTEQELSLTVIPLLYRNRSLSKILYTLKILDYPWNPAWIEGTFEVLSDTQDNQQAVYTFPKTKIEFPLFKNWVYWETKIFSQRSLLLTSSDATPDQLIAASKTHLQQHTIVVVQLERMGYTIDKAFEFDLPDAAFGHEVRRDHILIQNRKTLLSVTESPQHQLALVILFHDVLDHDDIYATGTTNHIAFYAISALGKGQQTATELLTMISYLTYVDTRFDS